MDVKSGTTVGFVTVVGGFGGAIAGFVLAEVFNLKKPERLTQAAAAVGALTGAFIGGTLVAPSTLTPTAAAPYGGPQTPAGTTIAQISQGSTTSNTTTPNPTVATHTP